MAPERARAQSVAISRSAALRLLLKTTQRLAFTIKENLLPFLRDPLLGSATKSVILRLLPRHTAFTFCILQTAFKTGRHLPYKVLNYFLNLPRLHDNLSLRTLLLSFDTADR